MFKKILRILTYNGDGDGNGDNICGDGVGMGTLVMGMGGMGTMQGRRSHRSWGVMTPPPTFRGKGGRGT